MRKENCAHGPQLLPDGDWILFTLRSASQDSWDQAHIVAQSLASGERVVLIEHGRDARYAADRTPGLRTEWGAALACAVRSVRARRVTGPAVPLVDGLLDADLRTGAMHFTVSNDGTLVYVTGGSGARATLSWVDRNGRRDPLPAGPLSYSSARVSPDGYAGRGRNHRFRWSQHSHLRSDSQEHDAVDVGFHQRAISLIHPRRPTHCLLLRFRRWRNLLDGRRWHRLVDPAHDESGPSKAILVGRWRSDADLSINGPSTRLERRTYTCWPRVNRPHGHLCKRPRGRPSRRFRRMAAGWRIRGESSPANPTCSCDRSPMWMPVDGGFQPRAAIRLCGRMTGNGCFSFPADGRCRLRSRPHRHFMQGLRP